ncbi:MAG TPA: [LysW]-aminoadipate kinase [Micromonosporaceae bacterium]|nr:[LysW]-aminoadipate kinase [Micromonosporaceae bacterium]
MGGTGPDDAAPIVVKVSGKVSDSYQAVVADLAGLARAGRPVVLVHGGSATIDQVSRERGIAPRRVVSASGIEGRFTGEADIATLLMATAGLVNKSLVVQLHQHGVAAFGLSGMDGGLLRGPRKDVLRVVEGGRTRLLRGNHSGYVEQVDDALLRALIGHGVVPVLAPLALSWDGRVINVDGDRVAAAVATSLKASDLVLLSDVEGLTDGMGGALVRHGRLAELDARLMPMASGRMRVKLAAAATALTSGVARVAIASALAAAPVTAALSGGGTQLFPGDPVVPGEVDGSG